MRRQIDSIDGQPNSRFRRPAKETDHRLPRLRAALRRRFGAGHDGLLVDRQPSGFSDDMIDALLRMQNHLAVAAKMAVLGKLANNMLTTYLGGDAGKRVLNGQIRRGDGETIRAALVMGDMRQSTVYAEKEGRQNYIDTLNQFFDAIAAPFNRNGGEILSFHRRRLSGRLSLRPPQGPLENRLPEAALSAVHQASGAGCRTQQGRADERT
jgi:adenylate cyclase